MDFLERVKALCSQKNVRGKKKSYTFYRKRIGDIME